MGVSFDNCSGVTPYNRQACALPKRKRLVWPSKTTIASGAWSTSVRKRASLAVNSAVRSSIRPFERLVEPTNFRLVLFARP